jgi:hypothetical protein
MNAPRVPQHLSVSLHEQAADDRRLRAAHVGRRQQLRQPLAQVVHLLVQAPDVVARLLQHPRRWYLHWRKEG